MTAKVTFISDLWSNIWSRVNGFWENHKKPISVNLVVTSQPLFSRFLRFSQKPLTLDHMLLHKSNINMNFAVILSWKTSLYHLPGPKYECKEYPSKLKTLQYGRGQKYPYPIRFEFLPRHAVWITLRRSDNRWKNAFIMKAWRKGNFGNAEKLMKFGIRA